MWTAANIWRNIMWTQAKICRIILWTPAKKRHITILTPAKRSNPLSLPLNCLANQRDQESLSEPSTRATLLLLWTSSLGPGLPRYALNFLATPCTASPSPGLPFPCPRPPRHTLGFLATPWTCSLYPGLPRAPWTTLPSPGLPRQDLDCPNTQTTRP